MSKRLILVLALAFVLGIGLAYAEVQNVKVSGDIGVMPISRQSLTLRDNSSTTNTPGTNDMSESINAIIGQVRVRVDADLTDNVSTTVRLLNERAWGEEGDSVTNGSGDTDISLDLAYVTLKEFLYSPLTLTIGRQNLRYGNGLIIGDPDTNGLAAGPLPNALDDLSLRKAFDAAKATLNYDPLMVDLIYAKVDENSVAIADDVDLYGLNASYAVNKDLNTEAYFFQRTRSKSSAGMLFSDKAEKTKVVGARGVYTGIENLMLGLEGAYQFGNHISSTTLYPDDSTNAANPRSKKVRAYALQAIGNLALPKIKYTPTVGGSYTYLSGDKYLSVSDTFKGWNPMFEDQAGGTLFNKILGYSNAQIFNVNGTLKPMEDVKVVLNYYYLRLNNPYNELNNTINLSGVVGDPTYTMKPNELSLGSEIDLGLVYDYTEDVQFGLSGAAFIPGSAFRGSSDSVSGNRKTATQLIGSMKVTF